VPTLCRALYKDSRLVKNPNLVLKTDEGADLPLPQSSTAAPKTVMLPVRQVAGMTLSPLTSCSLIVPPPTLDWLCCSSRSLLAGHLLLLEDAGAQPEGRVCGEVWDHHQVCQILQHLMSAPRLTQRHSSRQPPHSTYCM
jgi:hypothetical protein